MADIISLLESLPRYADPQSVTDIVTDAFPRLSDDSQYLEGMRTVVPGAEKLYGVRVPKLRRLARGVAKTYRSDSDGLKRIALECWDRGSREHRLLAVFILAGVKGMEPQERWSLGVRLLPDVSNWEECDQLCHAMLGEALAHEPGFMDELESWLRDENVWVRRAAIVTTVLLRRADYPDALARELDLRTLAMCRALLNDREKYIRKAVDWAIRETIKRRHDLACDWMMDQTSGELSTTARSTLKLAAKKLHAREQEAFLKAIE
jgi:3-methyladenine DNA glycosylase AlkD